MPITVVADATNSPPQFEVTISTPDGSPMTAVSLTRTVNGSTTPTRVQPVPGFASRYTEDPEPDWDTPVVYTAAITYAAGASTATMVADPATLTPSPLAFWAIHPTVPSRSMPLDFADFDRIGIETIGDHVNVAQATQHRILGSKFPTVTRIGSRLAPSSTLEVTTMSSDERNAISRLLDDETPILFRAPAAWGTGFEAGYYAVGDVAIGRRLQYMGEQSRTVKLPIQRVTPPAGVQQSNWSWGGLLATYSDWPSVIAAFDDWNAVTGNNPS
jgi:hypothetical protein